MCSSCVPLLPRAQQLANLQHGTAAQQLSAASLKRSNLLRQLDKEPLIARCIPYQRTIPLKSSRPQLRLTLARAPSTTLRTTRRILHFVRRISSLRISCEKRSHFGRIEAIVRARWSRRAGRGAFRRRWSSIARVATLVSALRPEVSWWLGGFVLRLVRLRLLGG
jgi:hypothetical protein